MPSIRVKLLGARLFLKSLKKRLPTMYQEIVKETVCEAHKRAIKNNAKAPLNVGTLFDLDELFQ